MGSPRCRSEGAEPGRRDNSRSAVFAKLGSTVRFAGEAGPGHVGIAGRRPSRGRIARMGWARHIVCSSRAHLGVARATRRAGGRHSSTPSGVGTAACTSGTGSGGTGAELGNACAFVRAGARSRTACVGPVMGLAAGRALCACSPGARRTSMGIAGRTIQGRHSDRAIVEPPRSGMEPARSGVLCAGSAGLDGLGRTPSRGSSATANRRAVVE